MSATEPEPEPAPEVSPTTALTILPEEPVSTTVPLETKRVALDFWTARRDLHDVNSKTYKTLNKKVEVLDGVYQRELAAWKGRKMMEPALRLESKKRRAETMAAKKQATVARLVDAVEGVTAVKDKTKLAAAVTAALEAPEPPKKKQKKGATKAAVEEDDDSE